MGRLAIHIQRREFISLIGGAAATWPLAARAQQARKIRRIGYVGGGSPGGAGHSGLVQGMASLGYTEGKDFVVEWRFAEGQFERFPALISDLIGLNVDVIVLGTTAAIRPAQN